MIQAWFDGVCEPKNPGGHGAYGVNIKFDDGSEYAHGVYAGYGEGISNNVAEYRGFVEILEHLVATKKQKEKIHIRGDSMLVIQQMSGRWRIKKGFYIPYALQAQKLIKKFRRKLILEWVPREQNEVCDKLAKDVLRNMKITFKIQPEAQ